jgi:chromosome segregation ATPase
MSFGVGLGDLLHITKVAWDIYKACKESSEDFRRLSQEVASLHVVLKETEDYIREFTDIDTSRRHRLEILTDGCNSTLQDLQKLLNSYESLGTQAQRTWDRMRFGLEDLADVRSRLVSNATLLTAFNSTLAKYVSLCTFMCSNCASTGVF